MREYKHGYCSGQSYSASSSVLEFQSHVPFQHSRRRSRIRARADAEGMRFVRFQGFAQARVIDTCRGFSIVVNPRRACGLL